MTVLHLRPGDCRDDAQLGVAADRHHGSLQVRGATLSFNSCRICTILKTLCHHLTGLIRMGVLLIVPFMHELTDSSTMGESATQRDSLGTPKAQGVAYGRCGR